MLRKTFLNMFLPSNAIFATACTRGTSTSTSDPVVSSREAFFTHKSASFDLVDACTQANISCDVITYDSDDEMVKSRRGIPFGGLRNKKGHPIYSREDIREQYCITRKELDVLEHNLHDSSATRLFGCLSTSHLPDSHCNKSSFLLLSCVHRRKNSSEIDEESDSGKKLLDNQKLTKIKKERIDDEDSSDGGFKQRISASRPITRTVKTIENSGNSNINTHQSSQQQRARFEKTSSSFDSDDRNIEFPLKRPTNLYFGDNRETSHLNTTSHSVDELNDRQTEWRNSRMAKTPDIIDDNRQGMKKHVTFATTHLVRSATVGGINNIHTSSTTPMNERLFKRIRVEPRLDFLPHQVNGPLIRKTDSNDSFDVKSTTSSTIYGYIPMYRMVRRAVMKTQATQTDTSSKRRTSTKSNRRSIPAYLTLSPRASKQILIKEIDRLEDSELSSKTSSVFVKSESVHRICGSNDDSDEEEEVMQISIKEKKMRKFNKTKITDSTKMKRRKVRTTKTSPKVSHETDILTNLHEIGFKKLDSSQESSRTDNIIRKEELHSKSSTDSSQLKSESDLMSSATNDLESSLHSIQSQDSSTIVSELNDSLISNDDKQQLIDEIIDDYVDASDVTKRPLIIDPKKAIPMKKSESFTSPDSDNYSFIGEQNKASSLRNEISPQDSSSPPVDNIDSGGSSVYVTATDNSPRVEKDKTSGHTSFDTASSGSRFSSPPSTEQIKSSTSDKEVNSPEHNENIPTLHKLMPSKSSKSVSPIKQIRVALTEETTIESSSESSDTCRKDRALSPESIASTHYSTEHNIEDFDSEDIGDLTPIQDLSTDTSTAIETSTVIENVVKPSLKPKIPPKPTFLLGDQKILITTDKPLLHQHLSVKVDEETSTAFLGSDEVVQSDDNDNDNDDIVDDVSGGEFICRRNMSGELSTVSEVSEEISVNGKSHKSDSGSGIQMLKIDTKRKISSDNNNNIGNDNVLSSSDNGAIRSNTPSFAESTTSGSFMCDGNVTEPTSLTESLDKPTLEKSGSFPCISGENLTKSFPIESSITDQLSSYVKEELSDKQDGQAVVETSQATDKDLENTEFSSQQMSIDDESVSQEAALQSNQSTSISQIETENEKIVSETDLINDVQKVEDVEEVEAEPKKQIENSVRRRRDHPEKCRTAYESSDISRPFFTGEEWKAIVQRRSRSLSKSPDKWMTQLSDKTHSCGHQHFTCRQCGESAAGQKVPSIFTKRGSLPSPYFKSISIDSTFPNHLEDDEDIGVHTESYRSALWVYIGYKDELTVWGHKCHKKSDNAVNGDSSSKLVRSESNESTLSEKQFRRQYESVTHRMIHRRASIEMYKRAINKTFVVEKEIIIHRINGEFGFRIHGSRPVVVSAIEKNTPAESCGLDVGDIVITINGCNVLDSSHSEVVKLAHSGTETLKLEVVSTRNALKNETLSESDINGCDVVINGYLTKFSTDSSNSGTKKLRKNRWFMLKTDNCLYWYKSTQEMDPLGVICLQGYTASCVPDIAQDEPFAFRLVKFGSEVKYFAAKDKDTVIQWINSINLVANKLNQADPYVDIALHNIHRNPSTFTNNDCCGYLAIFSQRRKVWRNRYFILKDAALYFYHDSNSNSALGVFFLHGYRVQSCILIGKKNTFESIPPEKKFKHLWLMADSDIDKKRWLAALEYSIDRWIRL